MQSPVQDMTHIQLKLFPVSLLIHAGHIMDVVFVLGKKKR